MKIMLVEDDAILNEAISSYFKQKNVFISTFHDGISAYESLNHLYNVCILDIDVPKLNGLELLKQIRCDYPNTYIIILSASVDIKTIEKPMNMDATIILKTFLY